MCAHLPSDARVPAASGCQPRAGPVCAPRLGLSPDGRTLWVSPSTGDYVTPVDTVTGAPGTKVTVGRSAFDVGLDWDGGTAYATTADGNRLVPVDTASGTAGAPLTTGAYPLAVALTPVPVE